MEDIIKLDSRGKKYLKKLKRLDNSESKTYVYKSEYPTIVSGHTKDGEMYISPSRGPMIIVGQPLQDQLVVKSIDYVEDYGYTITFY